LLSQILLDETPYGGHEGISDLDEVLLVDGLVGLHGLEGEVIEQLRLVLRGDGLAQEVGDLVHDPGKVGLHLLEGDEQHVVQVALVPEAQDVLEGNRPRMYLLLLEINASIQVVA